MGRPRGNINIDIQKLYLSGLSQREIKALGYGQGEVTRSCKPIARGKSESILLRLNKKPKSTGWRTCRARARKIMERHLGYKLKFGLIVHHKDGNYTNNALENLQVKTARDHTRDHYIEKPWKSGRPYNPEPRHKRAHRRAYMKHYNKVTRRYPSLCVCCGREYLKDSYAKGSTCSHKCGTTLAWKNRNVPQ